MRSTAFCKLHIGLLSLAYVTYQLTGCCIELSEHIGSSRLSSLNSERLPLWPFVMRFASNNPGERFREEIIDPPSWKIALLCSVSVSHRERFEVCANLMRRRGKRGYDTDDKRARLSRRAAFNHFNHSPAHRRRTKPRATTMIIMTP